MPMYWTDDPTMPPSRLRRLTAARLRRWLGLVPPQYVLVADLGNGVKVRLTSARVDVAKQTVFLGQK
jgi:hypothetical protein